MKSIVRTWTTEYEEILKHDRWRGRLSFGHVYMSGGVLYTRAVMTQEWVIVFAYRIVLGRVMETVVTIETERK